MATTRENIIVKFITKGAKKLEKSVDGLNRGLDKSTKGMKKSFKGVGQEMRGLNKHLSNFRVEFLSVMFGGMLIMRTFQGIMRQANETFMKISEGATPAGQAITALNAEMTFFRFTIGRVLGEALAPMLSKIIEVINTVRQWISDNPKLAAGLLTIGFLLGFLMFTMGSLVLLASGFAIMFTKANRAATIGLFKVFATIGLVIIILLAVIFITQNWGKDWKKVMIGMAIAVLALAAAVAIWFGLTAGLWVLVIGALVAGMIFVAAHWKELWLGMRIIAAKAWNGIISLVEIAVNSWLKAMEPIFWVMKKIGLIEASPRLDLSGIKTDMSALDAELGALRAENAAQGNDSGGMFGGNIRDQLEGFAGGFGIPGMNPQGNQGAEQQTSSFNFNDLIVNYSGEPGGTGEAILDSLDDEIKSRT